MSPAELLGKVREIREICSEEGAQDAPMDFWIESTGNLLEYIDFLDRLINSLNANGVMSAEEQGRLRGLVWESHKGVSTDAKGAEGSWVCWFTRSGEVILDADACRDCRTHFSIQKAKEKGDL